MWWWAFKVDKVKMWLQTSREWEGWTRIITPSNHLFSLSLVFFFLSFFLYKKIIAKYWRDLIVTVYRGRVGIWWGDNFNWERWLLLYSYWIDCMGDIQNHAGSNFILPFCFHSLLYMASDRPIKTSDQLVNYSDEDYPRPWTVEYWCC